MTETEKKLLLVPEYHTRIAEALSEEDWDYLEKPCFKHGNKKPYKIFTRKKVDYIENTSYSGVIQLENIRVHFSTKVKTNLFYMLSFLKSEKDFLFDPEISIELKEGKNFFDIIGRLFLNELEEIIKQGLLKKYITKHENVGFLKGKLSIKGQIQNHIHNVPKLSCTYGDLTVNNLENQIVLKALKLLIPMIRFNENLITDLTRYEYMLKDFVELEAISYSDCDKIHFNRLNEHYDTIIQFSKLILEENFIKSVHKGESRGFNFVVNMNKVYENFITEMVKEVVEKDFICYEIGSQTRFDRLVRGEKRGDKLITVPDIILKCKNSESYPLIIDAKYKREDKNADYYQVIAYSLAIPNVRACCLIYPQTENDIEKELILRRDLTNPETSEVKLYASTVNLDIGEKDDNLEFSDFIECIKTQISEIISNCLKDDE